MRQDGTLMTLNPGSVGGGGTGNLAEAGGEIGLARLIYDARPHLRRGRRPHRRSTRQRLRAGAAPWLDKPAARERSKLNDAAHPPDCRNDHRR